MPIRWLSSLLILCAACGDSDSSEGDAGATDAGSDSAVMADAGDAAPPPMDGGSSDAGSPDSGPEPCDPEGATRAASCGNCGLRSEVCGDDGDWHPASECLDEGECAPGTVERMELEMCAQESRICDDTCTWSDWDDTMPPGPCTTGETRVAHGPCSEGGEDYEFLEQECSGTCEWAATGTCDDGCDYSDGCPGFMLDPCASDDDCIADVGVYDWFCHDDGYCTHRGYCASTKPCPTGLVCAFPVGEENYCRRDGALVGDSCTTDEDCGAPLRCFEGACTKQCSDRCSRGWTCDSTSSLCRRIPDA